MQRVWGLFFCLASTLALAGNIDPIDLSGYRMHHEPDSPNRLTFAGLKQWIADHNVTDIDALLDSWQKDAKRSEILQSFTLIYSSRSLQRGAVDPGHPRVLFHKDGLIGALTGNPDKPASYRQMEIIEFEPERHDWAFHAVEFPEHADEAVKYEDNPARCTQCHGEKLRPIWGTYPLWPGAYFSDREEMGVVEGKNFHDFNASLGKPEMKRYRYFMKDQSSLHVDANLEMSTHLSWMNFNHMMAELKNSPSFEAYQWAYYAASHNACGSIETFLPEKIRQAHEAKLGRNAAAVIAETKAISHEEFVARQKRFMALTNTDKPPSTIEFDADYAEQVGRLRYVVEGQSLDPSLDMKPWSLSYEPGGFSWNFSTGQYGFNDFSMREFAPYMRALGVSAGDYWSIDCDSMRKRSLEALEKL